ncbi:protein-tyrosine phosphatase-like protein [Auriculariales sp. MPI-PUGE-AT-0066]|nr:protein-tyrosine phosphatase-like protein [Auriculariales sp. MPI-PUGE-AT-0066]
MPTKGGPTSPISLVLPNIYLGPASAASSAGLLASKSITHVLSVGAKPSSPVEGVHYARISLNDTPESSIVKVCDEASTIIDAALASRNGAILVHCSAGISRSPMVVTAYLMRKHDMTLKAALRQILQVRPQTSPNPGFLQQLKELELELRGEVSLNVDQLPKREKDRLELLAE